MSDDILQKCLLNAWKSSIHPFTSGVHDSKHCIGVDDGHFDSDGQKLTKKLPTNSLTKIF